MSRTDKTDPFYVQLAHDHELRREVHDHRFGDCDIDDDPDYGNPYGNFRKKNNSRCFYTWKLSGEVINLSTPGRAYMTYKLFRQWIEVERRSKRRNMLHKIKKNIEEADDIPYLPFRKRSK